MQTLRGAWAKYALLLQTRPLITNAITSGVIAVSGDLLAQRLERPEGGVASGADTGSGSGTGTSTGNGTGTAPPHAAIAESLDSDEFERQVLARDLARFGFDWRRAASMALWSTLFVGPFWTAYHRYVDRVLPLRTAGHICACAAHLLTIAPCTQWLENS
jgi:hypothetical protein